MKNGTFNYNEPLLYLYSLFFKDLSDANEQLSEAVVANEAILASKRKLEQEYTTLSVSSKTIILLRYYQLFYFKKLYF